jgi:hypothetical protein
MQIPNAFGFEAQAFVGDTAINGKPETYFEIKLADVTVAIEVVADEGESLSEVSYAEMQQKAMARFAERLAKAMNL